MKRVLVADFFEGQEHQLVWDVSSPDLRATSFLALFRECEHRMLVPDEGDAFWSLVRMARAGNTGAAECVCVLLANQANLAGSLAYAELNVVNSDAIPDVRPTRKVEPSGPLDMPPDPTEH